MKKNLLLILSLFAAFLMTVPAFGQTEGAQNLVLGNYDNQKREGGSWDGFNMQNAPVIFTYNHSGSQVLYRPAQLEAMKGKQITSMSFKCYPEGCYVDGYKSTMKLYVQEMDSQDFYYDEVGEYYEWVKFDKNDVAATLDFTGNFLTAYEDDIEITFDLSAKPFNYTGKTLVVTIVNDAPVCIGGDQGAIRFYWIDSQKEDKWGSFVFASDDITFEENQAKNNAVKPLENEDKWKNVPAVKFAYTEPKLTAFSGGEGTAANPYLISKIQDLQQMDEWTNLGKTADTYFKLTKDLTEEPFTSIIGSKGGNFRGHFDGDNHTVLMNVNLPDSSYVGMFGCVLGGSLRNLVVSGEITGDMFVGGPMGEAANGAVVENVVNCANVSGSSFVGGVIGQVVQQNDAPTCSVSRCVNYGTVTGTGYMSIGGVIGDVSGVDGNSVLLIANYGLLKATSKYSGGLAGNVRPADRLYYGLSLGTYSSTKSQGCFGNCKSSTVGNIFFDKQYLDNPKANPLQARTTSDLVGDVLQNYEKGNVFPEADWLFAKNMYPRLKVNGFENTPTAVLYATPVMLAADNTLQNISKEFTVVTDNSVVWTSKNGNIEIAGSKATPVKVGEDILVATLGTISREIKVNVTAVAGVENAVAGAQNTVTTVAGAIVLNLAENAQVAVFDITGKVCVNADFAEGVSTIELANGVYIVKIGNKAHKVCVRG